MSTDNLKSLLTPDEERDLVTAARSGDGAALERLVIAFEPAIGRVSHRHGTAAYGADDAAQDARMGFIDAVLNGQLVDGRISPQVRRVTAAATQLGSARFVSEGEAWTVMRVRTALARTGGNVEDAVDMLRGERAGSVVRTAATMLDAQSVSNVVETSWQPPYADSVSDKAEAKATLDVLVSTAALTLDENDAIRTMRSLGSLVDAARALGWPTQTMHKRYHRAIAKMRAAAAQGTDMEVAA